MGALVESIKMRAIVAGVDRDPGQFFLISLLQLVVYMPMPLIADAESMQRCEPMSHHQVRREQLEQQVEEVVCLRRNTRVMRETLIDCQASVGWHPTNYFMMVYLSELCKLLRLLILERFLVVEVDIRSQHLGMVFEHSELWHRYCVCAI